MHISHDIPSLAAFHMAQNFGGRKLWQIATNKHFSGQNIGGLHSKIARIKIVDG